MALSLGCANKARLQYTVALQGFLAEYQLPYSRRDRRAGGFIVHRMCTKTRGVTLGALKCREPELLHDEEGARVTYEELRDLEVGYEYDYSNHVPRGTLTAYDLQGYVLYTLRPLPHYYIDRS